MALLDGAVEHNLRVMAALAQRESFVLAPHVKTTMCPELIRRQLDAGAWGVTVANVTQARVAADAGAERILIANEVLSRPDAEWLASVSDSLELLCLVDCVDGVQTLDAALQSAGCAQPISVLVEVGSDGGRTGVRTRATAHDVCRAVRTARDLRLVGVEGYEGAVGSRRSPADLAAVDQYLEELRATAVELADAGYFDASAPMLVSAGGSKFFDRVISALGRDADFGGHASSLVLRSGCYVVHDHGLYAEVTPLGANVPQEERLRPAIQIWAEVLSRPEPGLAIVGLGRRDASFDSGLPVLLAAVGRDQRELSHDVAGQLVKLDDQHGYLAVDPADSSLSVGDRLVFGISHPCTTFDKWRQVLLVDQEQRVLRVLETRFH
ncbi:MAG TPA: alanine racemase [Solirubrobacteraceae bacterium]|jgi:D-serine deaminase-like pyridoxal phosphate-dependent protein|nr:alanine racemase [Solirubrobacteraceae bacterium]